MGKISGRKCSEEDLVRRYCHVRFEISRALVVENVSDELVVSKLLNKSDAEMVGEVESVHLFLQKRNGLRQSLHII